MKANIKNNVMERQNYKKQIGDEIKQ